MGGMQQGMTSGMGNHAAFFMAARVCAVLQRAVG